MQPAIINTKLAGNLFSCEVYWSILILENDTDVIILNKNDCLHKFEKRARHFVLSTFDSSLGVFDHSTTRMKDLRRITRM